ncbi:MAG: PilZ domain-containing protein [Halieaceae bacterium]|nr:PilZ domain-containing protein [Halieaceae bacterium]
MEGLQDQGEGLTFRDELPLRMKRVERSPSPSALRQQQARNEMLLRVCIAMQDHHEVEERGEISAELARLDLKLDLLISCVNQLMAAKNNLPPPVAVTLTTEGVSWQAANSLVVSPFTGNPEPGGPQKVLADLFINPLVPMPLSLHGTLYEGRADGGERSWNLVFDMQGEAQVALLEKLIFRYHRQAVAMGLDD